MFAFLIGFIFAAIQVFLIKFLIKVQSANSKKITFLIVLAKFLSYGIVVALFNFLFSAYADNFIYGFISGFPLVSIIMFLYTLFSKQINCFIKFIISKIKKPWA